MMGRRIILLAVLSLLSLVVFVGVSLGEQGPVLQQEALAQPRVYAYKDWQSIGVMVHQGEIWRIAAQGRWSYTPGEFHGPDGHRIFPAPTFYPLPYGRGGTLIARVGDGGDPILVGAQNTLRPDVNGTLFLRINDDILSDNKGFVELMVEQVQTGE